jgi:hypothetical protein
MSAFVTCESVAAVTLHIRETTDTPVNYSGFARRPKALCDAVIAWDTQIPVSAARCMPCIAAYQKIVATQEKP